MLKGQIDIDIEFMGGTIIFVVLGSLMYLMLLAPLLAVQHSVSEANEDVVGMEFSNIAKYRLIRDAGDGNTMTTHSGISAAASARTHTSGTAGGYFTVTDVVTERVWEFDGDRNKDFSHETFAAMRTDFMPVSGGSDVVLQAGKDYVVHAYSASGTLMFDIHDEIICGTGASEEPGFSAPLCEDVKTLTPTALDAGGISGSLAIPVKNGIQESVLMLVSATSEVKAKELVPAGLDLADEDECVAGKAGVMCVRIVGRHVLPVKIYAEATGEAFSFADLGGFGGSEVFGGGAGSGGEY